VSENGVKDVIKERKYNQDDKYTKNK